MNVFPIYTDADYELAMEAIDTLMDLNDGDGPEDGSLALQELDILSVLAESYERKRFPMDDPDPRHAVKYALEIHGLDQSDLARILSSKPRASELLNGTGNMKGLSRSQMQLLHTNLHIPAEILIRDFPQESEES
ncbi:transcriptional regulator [Terasakiella sp. A23]|uniref:helix-turn-helix domain-containing protein n=1 Tax=Terasakiella sp. FCG-A23 TaxID=3080561 RepID=UPI002952EFC0|nr:transcriptional regulator [Terasakiella sp. A23]MDV7339163.1 transcriptional regulator [Terasakiella sp. A23]